MDAALPTLADVRAAAARLRGSAHWTPVLRSRALNERTQAEVFLKAENLQRGGAFKFRGAMHRLLLMTEEERRRGVVAYSSGNHAQAVALAGRELGISAALVMPRDAPRLKLEAVRGYGGEVHLYDRDGSGPSRERIAAELVQREHRVLVPPFDDAAVIAGAGTAALELLEEVGELDALVAPVGGGGLISGSAVAAHGLFPNLTVYGVEPATAADVKLSLERGTIVAVPDNPTIADGLRTVQTAPLPFSVMRQHVTAIATVTDDQIREAMRWLLLRMKTLVEPSGAAGIAALLAGALPRHCRIGIILSGGNVDTEVLAGCLE